MQRSPSTYEEKPTLLCVIGDTGARVRSFLSCLQRVSLGFACVNYCNQLDIAFGPLAIIVHQVGQGVVELAQCAAAGSHTQTMVPSSPHSHCQDQCHRHNLKTMFISHVCYTTCKQCKGPEI